MSHEYRYHPSPDQTELVNALCRPLDTLLPLSRLHQSESESDETWSGLESLGLFGISVSEAANGSGLGATEEALVAMELGQQLAAPSVLATIGAAHSLPEPDATPITGTQRIAAAFRQDRRIIVIQDTKADLVLLRDGPDAVLCDNHFPTRQIDEQLWLATLLESESTPKIIARFDASGLLRLRMIDAAALSGIAETALSMSVGYACTRKQFGWPIGSFQAVKHHCANMAIAARQARDQTTFAAIAVDDNRDDAPFQVECALHAATTAALHNAGMNIQIHGGIGFSDEADAHLFLKRARVLTTLSGGTNASISRLLDKYPGPARKRN